MRLNRDAVLALANSCNVALFCGLIKTAGTRWSAAKDTRTGWLEVDLGAEKAVRRAVIDESSYPWTRKFEIQAIRSTPMMT